MNPLRKLAGQTAVYGLSSIVGRLLNYLLTPLHTAFFLPEEYGVITELYAYVAFLVALLMYGMETAFFRFVTKEGQDQEKVFSTALISLSATTGVFLLAATFFSQSIANWMLYPDHMEYVVWFGLIVGLDALSNLPLARLRQENKPMRFAIVNLSSVAVNILLNLFFIGYCMSNYEAGNSNALIDLVYDPEIGVGYVFIANLISSGVKFALLVPTMLGIKMVFDKVLWRRMINYALPLLLAGLAGIVNETLDRILLKRLLANQMSLDEAMAQVGIYGAVYKISIIITLFVQAFRYAAEPFFFAQAKEKNAKKVYARVMTYFVIITAAIFLGVNLYIDIFKYFISNREYWVGLNIVPILLLANLFLGVYYNLSVWYKLTEKTIYGAYLSALGAGITILLNVLLIPWIGYEGSAWATLACYSSMAVGSWYLGRKHYPIPYNMRKILFYLGMSLFLFAISRVINLEESALMYLVHTALLLIFAALVYWLEKPGPQKLSES